MGFLGEGRHGLMTMEMFDAGDAVITRMEYDRPLAGIVERLDRDGDGALSMKDRWHRDDDRRWDDD